MLRAFVCLAIALALVVGGDALAGGQKTPVGGAGAQGKEMKGEIVRVDPEKNVVVIRTREGDKEREQEFKVAKDTKYLGADRKDLAQGLRDAGFRKGVIIWYRAQPPRAGADPTLSELRLGPPAPPGGKL